MKYLKYVFLITSLVTSGFFFYVRFWATDKALTYEGPSFIQTSADQYKLSILVQNKLVNVWRDGQINDVMDIGLLGKRIHGDFGYFPNGDLLFYHYDKETPVLDQIAKYLRIRDTNQKPAEGEEGFYRCELDTRQCSRWAPSMPAIGDHAFGLEIDPQTSEVYISATEKFEIYKYSGEGDQLAKNDTDLFFPNVLKLVDGQLYIADTNHHRIKVVSPSTHNFGEKLESHQAEIEGTEWRWPSVVENVDGEWWVMLSGDNMAWGRFLKFSSDWSQSEEVKLPDWSWPVGVAYFDHTVWIADLENFEVYRYSPSGEQLESLGGEEWRELLRESDESKAYYENISFGALLAMITCFVLGFIGVYLTDKKSQDYFKDQRETVKPADGLFEPIDFSTDEIVWFEHQNIKLINRSFILITVCLVPALFSVFVGVIFFSVGWGLLFWFGAIAIVQIAIMYVLRESALTKLGVTPSTILIKSSKGYISERHTKSVHYTDRHLFVGRQAIIYTNEIKPPFPAEVIEGHLKPRLDPNNKIHPIAGFVHLLRIGDSVNLP